MLSPTSHRLADVIRTILVRGEQNQVLSIEINQADGDRSVMTIGKPSDS